MESPQLILTASSLQVCLAFSKFIVPTVHTGIIQALGSFVFEPVHHLAIYTDDANIINLFEVAAGFVYKKRMCR